MRAGLVSISFRELSPEEIVNLVADCGLEGIEWGGDIHVPHGDLQTARKVAQLTTEAGLEVASYGSYYRFEECDIDAESGGPSMESVLDTAEALGAPAIRVWAGQRGPEDTSEGVFSAIANRARQFASEAATRGLRLDFEFHENTLTETPDKTIKLLQAVDHPSAKTLWQPPLLTSSAGRLEGLQQVKDWISNVHCNHFGQNPWPGILSLEEGTDEWKQYLYELADIPGDRWLLIEHVKDHSPEYFRKDAAALLRWLKVN
jgi:sugar phosphate isomerase/epimerase